jgi:hypothetical protein
MSNDLLVITIDCHTDLPEDRSVIRTVETPEVDYLIYAFPDKPNERYTTHELQQVIKEVNFKRTSELVLLVTDTRSGKSRALVCPLRWPKEGEIGTSQNKIVFDLSQNADEWK